MAAAATSVCSDAHYLYAVVPARFEADALWRLDVRADSIRADRLLCAEGCRSIQSLAVANGELQLPVTAYLSQFEGQQLSRSQVGGALVLCLTVSRQPCACVCVCVTISNVSCDVISLVCVTISWLFVLPSAGVQMEVIFDRYDTDGAAQPPSVSAAQSAGVQVTVCWTWLR